MDRTILIKTTNDDGEDVFRGINSMSDLPAYVATPAVAAVAAGDGGVADISILVDLIIWRGIYKYCEYSANMKLTGYITTR